MPGRSVNNLNATPELLAQDKVEQLESSLQTRFEDDIARIFDKSIYSDFELVCGKSSAAAQLSPDSLADSDYWSLARQPLNVDRDLAMENAVASDSGAENGLMESLSGPRSALTDSSLTLLDLLDDSPPPPPPPPPPRRRDASSSKEEKQRHNEEIVTLESSSVSSEAGSWEPVFPGRAARDAPAPPPPRGEWPAAGPAAQSYFIDAASLADDEAPGPASAAPAAGSGARLPTQPMPCSTTKTDLSPGEWSEHDNDDSLDARDPEPDSLQKDLSPTIFDMTLVTEDSLNSNAFEDAQEEHERKESGFESGDSCPAERRPQTPHNSILSLLTAPATSDDGDSDSTLRSQGTPRSLRRPAPEPRRPDGAAWTVDMRGAPEARADAPSHDSDCSERSHKYYIDLGSLSSEPQEDVSKSASEKKNIFSMYIDLGENSAVKEMPARLSDSLNAKKAPEKKKPREDVKPKPKGAKPARPAPPRPGTKDKAVKVLPESPKNIPFEKYEALCENLDMSITEIIKSADKPAAAGAAAGLPRLDEEPLLVRLSDLDRPKREERMTRSIPDSRSHGLGGRTVDIMHSFHSENAQSLSRLFPNLRELSRSSPAVAAAEPDSDSIFYSSYCRSLVVENSTSDDSPTASLLASCQSKLGQDLLRMFLEEIAPDVVVEVYGRRFKAHKCILASRCQYFAAILSGGWVESAGNVIALPPFSHNVVHFALCHIYSGVATIPESVSIVELATLVDMLNLEGLKEAIMFNLKSKYCHHFHNPCAVCIAGVLECFPLLAVYGFDDLFAKCLKWIARHFQRVWPTKAFATLPKDLLERCYQQQARSLTPENAVDAICASALTAAGLERARWADGVRELCQRLQAAAARALAPRLRRALGSLERAAPPPAAAAALRRAVLLAIECAPPAEELSRSFAFLASYRASRLPGGLAPPGVLWQHGDAWWAACQRALAAPPRDQRPDRRGRPEHQYNSTRSLDMKRLRSAFLPPAKDMGSQGNLESPRAPLTIRMTKAQEDRQWYIQSHIARAATGKPRPETVKPRHVLARKTGATGPATGPAAAAKARTAGAAAPGPRVLSVDSLSDSRPHRSADSLSEDKYATYTKRSRPAASTSGAPRPGAAAPRSRIPVAWRPARTEGNAAPRAHHHKAPGSLMMATKASSAKVVAKATTPQKQKAKPPLKAQGQTAKTREKEPPKPIQVMERSSTFLKDEPTFGEFSTQVLNSDYIEVTADK